MKRYRAIAEYYDPEYAANDMLHRDVPFLLERLPSRSQRILEIATGTARAAIPLAQAGHRVVGIDYARDMLEIARRKRDAVGLRERELELIQADALDLDLGRQFDFACILFNTFLNFTTLEEQDRLLANIRRHLRPRGRIWIDIFNPDPGLLAQPHSENLEPTLFYVHSLDRTVQRTTDVQRHPDLQLQRITFKYCWYDAEGNEHFERVSFDLTHLFPRELRLLLERHGFEITSLWGDYDGSEVTADSPRLICDARLKPARAARRRL